MDPNINKKFYDLYMSADKFQDACILEISYLADSNPYRDATDSIRIKMLVCDTEPPNNTNRCVTLLFEGVAEFKCKINNADTSNRLHNLDVVTRCNFGVEGKRYFCNMITSYWAKINIVFSKVSVTQKKLRWI